MLVAGYLSKPHLARRLALGASTVAIALALTVPTTSYAYERITNYVSNGHGSLSPQYLVIHETANPGASAWNTCFCGRVTIPTQCMMSWS